MHVFNLKKNLQPIVSKEGKKQSLSYVTEGQTGHQSLRPV